jgi:hypothetical protein
MLVRRILIAFFAMSLAVVVQNEILPIGLTATCTGSDPCHACKNCKYCKHCAKDGGKCGVCK